MTSEEAKEPQHGGFVMGRFERYLSLWVGLCILCGIALGASVPELFRSVAGLEAAEVNLPVAVLIWLMITPMMLKVDFSALHQVAEHWRGIGVTVFVNWAVKPFSMALLGWVLLAGVFAPWLPAGEVDAYIAGLILLAAAPCTAMAVGTRTSPSPKWPSMTASWSWLSRRLSGCSSAYRRLPSLGILCCCRSDCTF